jgi:hypothetical protein
VTEEIEIPADAIVVADVSLRIPLDHAIVASNVDFVNALFAEHIRPDEISADALRSYYVDHYLQRAEGRGITELVRRSWTPRFVELVREGLGLVGARQHLRVIDAVDRVVAALPVETRHHPPPEIRAVLDATDAVFRRALAAEPLLARNAAWLRAHPKLVALSADRVRLEIARRAAAVPDRERRIAEARAAEPELVTTIRALCARAGQELVRITAGDPSRVHEGAPATAWHFLTNEGHHHVVFADRRAILFRGSSTTAPVCEIALEPPTSK